MLLRTAVMAPLSQMRIMLCLGLACGFSPRISHPRFKTSPTLRSSFEDFSEERQLERPVVTLKVAFDSQNAVDDLSREDSWRFTSESSLDLVHRLRAISDAVAVGSGTVLRDNPSLTVRRVDLPPGRSQPLRVVFDRRLRIPWSCKLLQDEHKTQVFTLNEPSDALSMALKENKFINAVSSGPEGLRRSLALLKRRDGVRHLMVEGGPELARSFLENKLVDRAIVISAEGVTFKDPIASGLTSGSFAAAGLECVSVYASSGDSVQCWSKVGVSWPSFPEAAELWP